MFEGDDEPKPPRGRRRLLNREDRELWRHVASGIAPIAGKGRVPTHGILPADPPKPGPARMTSRAALTEPAPAHQSSPAKSVGPAKPIPPTPGKPQQRAAVAKPAAPPATPAVLDRRKARRLAKGREPIEARIDLHGMRQSEAHVALRGFLLRCFGAGIRQVLVITGKGMTGADEDDRDWMMGQRERGVLRRNVPRWLAEPDLAAVVSGTAPAHLKHGGDGALYVMLRNGRGREAD